MRKLFTLCTFLVALIALPVKPARQPDPPHREWKAAWITHPTAPLREPLVLHFRHALTLTAVPAQLSRPRQRR